MAREIDIDEKMELVCGTCQKPVSLRARSDVTRFLSVESRCSCLSPTLPPGQSESFIVVDEPEADLAAAKEEVQMNLGERYEVVSLLGQGGMGAVYKVKDKVLERTFAIKMLNPALVSDSNSVKRFEQEAQAASSLTHANLVAVYEYGMGKKGSPLKCLCHHRNLSKTTVLHRIWNTSSCAVWLKSRTTGIKARKLS